MIVPDRDHDLRLAQARAPATESPLPPKPAARAATPPWVPEGVAYELLPERARAMIAEIVTPAREDLLQRHLQLIYAKFKAANYLIRVRDSRRELARALRQGKAERPSAPNPAPSGEATPPGKSA
jgi:hypothetical protein